MADSRIKGITIELDGETTGLQKALADVTKQSIDIQKELKDVDRLLKFDPSNVEAMAQKQKLLASQIEVTSEKLNRLRDAEEQVNEQFSKGEIGEAQFRAFRREIEYTEGSLDKLKGSLAKMDDVGSVEKVKTNLSEIPEESEKAEGSIKELGGELTELLAGAAAVEGIHELMEKAFEASSTNTKITVSMELNEGSQQAVKNAINSVTAYGVDAEAALEGVRRQWALNKDASDESNAAVVKAAATITAAYGDIDFTELIQETNELSKSLNISNEDAMGLVYSLLKMGFPPDQLDVITEYGSQLSRAGYNAQEIQGIMAAGVKTGSWNIDVLLDGLKEGRIRLAEFGQGISDSTAALLDGTGVSATQLQSWGKAVAAGGETGKKAMSDVAAAVANVDDKTKQNALGVAIFGTQWEENGTKITDTILGMNDNLMTAEANQNNLNAAAQDLNADPAIKMQEAINSLTIALTPLLLEIAEVVAAIAGWISANPNLSATIIAIVTAITLLIGIGMGLAGIFTTVTSVAELCGISLAAIVGPIGIAIAAITALIAIGVLLYQNWDYISEKSQEIWSAIQSWLSETWLSISETAVSSWNELKEFLSQTFENIKTNAIDIWESVVSFFTQSIPAWIEQISEWFLTLPNKLAYALGFALGTIIKWGTETWTYLSVNVPVWIQSIGNFFSTLPSKILVWLVNVMTNIASWGSDIASWIATNVPIWINNIVLYFSKLPSEIWNWLSQCIDSIKTWGANMLSEAVNGAIQTFDGIVNTFTNLPSKMLDIGGNIVAGLKEGINGAWDGMTGWMGGLVDNFVDGLKDSLDIHSPSRVMMKIGAYTGEGFELGIESTIGNISKQANAIADAAIPNINAGIYDMGVNYSPIGASNSISAGSNLDAVLNKIDNLANAITNMKILMDSKQVGKLVAPTVSSNLAFNNSRKGW